MATLVLVPGAMHGKWTWDRVTPLLEAAGHRLIAEDLPGMAIRTGSPPAEAVTPGMSGLEAGGVASVGATRGGGEAAASLDPSATRALLYQQRTTVDADWALARLRAEPMRPLATPAVAVGWLATIGCSPPSGSRRRSRRATPLPPPAPRSCARARPCSSRRSDRRAPAP